MAAIDQYARHMEGLGETESQDTQSRIFSISSNRSNHQDRGCSLEWSDTESERGSRREEGHEEGSDDHSEISTSESLFITQDQQEDSEQMKAQVLDLFGVCPKPGQIEALKTLLCHKEDLILIAKTGYGKSLIFQAAPLVCLESGPGICLILMPLTLLQEEQCEHLMQILP